MKTKTLIIALIFSFALKSFAQNSKHVITSGRVIFDITYPESQLDEKMMANMPSESTMSFKNDKSKVEVTMSMGKTTVISDNKTGEGTMLMDAMGNKWAMKINKADIMKEKEGMGKPKVELTREAKKIAGYNCYKAIVTVKTPSGDKTFDAWFTNDLAVKNSFSSQIEGIDGFLMEFVSMQNGMSMKMTARSVEPMDIADSEFNIPEGYTLKTMDDLKKMGGK